MPLNTLVEYVCCHKLFQISPSRKSWKRPVFPKWISNESTALNLLEDRGGNPPPPPFPRDPVLQLYAKRGEALAGGGGGMSEAERLMEVGI